MQIIEPEAHWYLDNSNQAKKIEYCARLCYASLDKMTKESYHNFIPSIINRGHESVLEHGNYIFKITKNEYLNFLLKYMSLSDGKYRKDGISLRLRFSLNEIDEYGIISGNVRAWRDYIRVILDTDESLMLNCVPTFFTFNILFCDLLKPYVDKYTELREYVDDKIKLVTDSSELTEEEQKIHITKTAIITCSRALSHELVRHRSLSPSQQSQRYVNYAKEKYGKEITFIKPIWLENSGIKSKLWKMDMRFSELNYILLVNKFRLKPQEAREVLPNSTATTLALTGTLADWDNFFRLRTAADAHPEARKIANMLLTANNNL